MKMENKLLLNVKHANTTMNWKVKQVVKKFLRLIEFKTVKDKINPIDVDLAQMAILNTILVKNVDSYKTIVPD